jgi:hypothetical protein
VLHAAALIPGILLTVLSAITLGSLLPDLRRAKLDLTSRLIILVWVLAFIVGIAWFIWSLVSYSIISDHRSYGGDLPR